MALEPLEHEDVRLGDGQRGHGGRVVTQIGAGPRSDFEHGAGCLGDQRLAHFGETGFLGPAHLAVVHGGEEPATKTHRDLLCLPVHGR